MLGWGTLFLLPSCPQPVQKDRHSSRLVAVILPSVIPRSRNSSQPGLLTQARIAASVAGLNMLCYVRRSLILL
jgi:hypothetical protein